MFQTKKISEKKKNANSTINKWKDVKYLFNHKSMHKDTFEWKLNNRDNSSNVLYFDLLNLTQNQKR